MGMIVKEVHVFLVLEFTLLSVCIMAIYDLLLHTPCSFHAMDSLENTLVNINFTLPFSRLIISLRHTWHCTLMSCADHVNRFAGYSKYRSNRLV